jgi:hypothetical protein
MTVNRKSASGPESSTKSTFVLGLVDVAATAGATATATMSGVKFGDNLVCNPVENLSELDVSLAWCRVVTDDTVVLNFVNAGASTSISASTWNATALKL